MPVPTTVLEAMTEALDKHLATRAPKYQVHYLLQQRQVWTDQYAAFIESEGEHGLVHPTLGAASAWDYATFLCVIDQRLQAAKVAA
jgi:K+-transporting ATPase c subunit